MLAKDTHRFGALGDGDSPTVGLSLSWWVVALVAAVYLIPQLYRVHRTTKKE